jgi:hypothetical protein
MKNQLAILTIVAISAFPATIPAQTTPRPQTATSGGVTTQTPFSPPRPPLQRSQFSATNSTFTPFPPGLTNQFGTNSFGTNGISGLPDDVILLVRDLQINVEQLRPILAAISGSSFEPGGVGMGGGATNFNTASGGAISNQSAGQNFGTVGGANFSSQAGRNISSSSAVAAGGTAPAATVQPRAINRAQTGFAAAGGAGSQIGTGAGFGANGNVSGGTQLTPGQLALLGNLQLVLQDVQIDAQELLPRLAQLTGGNVFTNGTGGLGDQSGTNGGFGNLTNTFAPPLTNNFGQSPSNGVGIPFTSPGRAPALPGGVNRQGTTRTPTTGFSPQH